MKSVSMAGAFLSALMLLVGTTAQANDTVKIANAQKGFWDTGIMVYGERQGFFRDAGLDLDITWTNGGAETEQAVIAGSVDIGAANGILGAVTAFAKGAPIRIVAAETTGVNDLYWYARAESGINSFADLAGKSVAFSSPGSSSNMVALALVDLAHVQVKLVATGGAPGTLTQVMSGQIDVGWSVPPLNFDLLDQGKLRIVGRGSDVAAMSSQTVRVFEANPSVLASRRAVLQRFFRAYQKSLDWSYTDPKALEYLASDMKVTVDQARRARDDFYPKRALSITPIANLDLTIQQAIQLKRLQAPLSAEQVKELIDIPYDPTKDN